MKMTRRAERALRKSIKHWKNIVAEKEPSKGTQDCALCSEFVVHACIGCPVRTCTRRLYCAGTPYERFRTTWDKVYVEASKCDERLANALGTSTTEKGRWAATPELKAIAQAEVDFLTSLLPDKKPKPALEEALK